MAQVEDWTVIYPHGERRTFLTEQQALQSAAVYAESTLASTVRAPSGKEWIVMRRDPRVTIIARLTV